MIEVLILGVDHHVLKVNYFAVYYAALLTICHDQGAPIKLNALGLFDCVTDISHFWQHLSYNFQIVLKKSHKHLLKPVCFELSTEVLVDEDAFAVLE